jgi:hypothetical protein
MERAYSLDEFMTLCFAFGLDFELIRGETKREKIRTFVGHFYRRRTLQVLIGLLESEEERPNETWRLNPDSEQE